MAASKLRRTVWGIGIAACVIALAAVLLPYVASTRLVGDRIAEEMSEWSGLVVTLDAPPEISIWPDLQANLSGVTLSLPDGPVVATAARAEIELSPFAALRGAVEFTAARFVGPSMRLDEDGSLPALPRGGRLAVAMAAARDIVAENTTSPDISRLPADRFGTLEFVDGSILRPLAGASIAVATALDGRIAWERLDGGMRASASGMLRGQNFSVDLSSANPLLLLAGADTPANFALKSNLANLSFEGSASLGGNPYMAGTTRFSTPSVSGALAWSGAGIPIRPAIESMTVASRIMGDPARVRLEDATITLDGKSANGVLDLLLNGPTPKVSGTMAFDTLDLGAFLSTFTPFDPLADGGAATIDPDFSSHLNLDLRLSAKRATLKTLALSDLAATARVDGMLAAFDISDASAFGGSVQAGLRFDHKAEGPQVEMRLLGSNVSGEALGAAMGVTTPGVGGKGTVSLMLKSSGESRQSFLSGASGSFSASFGQGTFVGLDVKALAAHMQSDAPLPLSDMAGASSHIDGLEIRAAIANGLLMIEKAEIRMPQQHITIAGTAALSDGNVALSGRLEPPGQDTAGTGTIPAQTFLIDGLWNTATIIPTTDLSAQ